MSQERKQVPPKKSVTQTKTFAPTETKVPDKKSEPEDKKMIMTKIRTFWAVVVFNPYAEKMLERYCSAFKDSFSAGDENHCKVYLLGRMKELLKQNPVEYLDMFEASFKPVASLLYERDIDTFNDERNVWAQHMLISEIFESLTENEVQGVFDLLVGGWMLIQGLYELPYEWLKLIHVMETQQQQQQQKVKSDAGTTAKPTTPEEDAKAQAQITASFQEHALRMFIETEAKEDEVVNGMMYIQNILFMANSPIHILVDCLPDNLKTVIKNLFSVFGKLQELSEEEIDLLFSGFSTKMGISEKDVGSVRKQVTQQSKTVSATGPMASEKAKKQMADVTRAIYLTMKQNKDAVLSSIQKLTTQNNSQALFEAGSSPQQLLQLVLSISAAGRTAATKIPTKTRD